MPLFKSESHRPSHVPSHQTTVSRASLSRVHEPCYTRCFNSRWFSTTSFSLTLRCTTLLYPCSQLSTERCHSPTLRPPCSLCPSMDEFSRLATADSAAVAVIASFLGIEDLLRCSAVSRALCLAFDNELVWTLQHAQLRATQQWRDSSPVASNVPPSPGDHALTSLLPPLEEVTVLCRQSLHSHASERRV